MTASLNLVPLIIEEGVTCAPAIPPYLNDSGGPISLVGCTARAMVRRDVNDTSPLLTFGTTTGEVVLGGTSGTVTVTLTPTQTTALIAAFLAAGSPVDGTWNLLLTLADGVTVIDYAGGPVTALRSATR